MASKFHSEVHRREEVTFLKLGGVIDEDNELGVLGEQMGPGTLVIDLSEIERINSCGVRDWVNWLGRVEKGGGRVVMVECSPSIVAQVNLVNNFTGAGVVKSFYAPYFCPSCDREKVLLIETRDAVGQATFRAPTCRCDECDGPMDFDDMEDSYFAFLSNTAKIATDSRVDDVVNEFTPSDAGSPKLRARTSPGLTPAGNGTPNPQIGSLPSVPSLPPLPAMRKSGEIAYTAVTTGKHLMSSTPPPGTGTNPQLLANAIAAGTASITASSPRVTPPFPMQVTTITGPRPMAPAPAPEPTAGKGWMVVVGVLVVAALGLVAYLVLGGPPSSPAGAATTPPAAAGSTGR